MSGRPDAASPRLPVEWAVYDWLDTHAIPYTRVDHPAAMTMEDCAAIEETLGAPICKNLVLCNRQQTAFYLLLMPGDKPFRTKELSAQIGSARLSFASEEQMVSLIGTTHGSASVLGLMNDNEHRVRLLIDKAVLRSPVIGCHPCANTSTLRLSTADLVDKILPALGYEPELVEL